VLFDATSIPPNRGGVGRYVEGLLPALPSTGVDLSIVAQARDVELFRSLVPGATVVGAPPSVARRAVRLAWEQSGLPRLARRLQVDVLHSPHYTRPLVGLPVAQVVTLHDATFFSSPGVHTPVKRTFFRTAIRDAARRADVLVVPSNATRDEVVAFTGADPGRFVVAYHGVDKEVFHRPTPRDVERARRDLGIGDGPYVAFLGTIEPRKNVPALIRAWARLATDRPDVAPALVLAGAQGWDGDVEEVARTVPGTLRLLRPGYVPLESLAGFLGGAEVVAYPSLGEGFGLPVLEAMACGAPVLTTRRLSLPEVGGDAVAYCDVDAASVEEGLRRLLDDPAVRSGLVPKALERSAQFTWQRAAEAHRDAYEIARRRRPRGR
jgi:glycosyltransferase involved in cell wall biosynthesis